MIINYENAGNNKAFLTLVCGGAFGNDTTKTNYIYQTICKQGVLLVLKHIHPSFSPITIFLNKGEAVFNFNGNINDLSMPETA